MLIRSLPPAAVSLIALVAAGGAWPQGTPTFRVQSNLVVVDVVARTGEDRLAADLRADDFRIYEDGVQQRIVTFSRESIPARGSGRALGVVSYDPRAPAGASALKLRNTRLTMLFFDLPSMTAEELMRAVEAAEAFVRTRTSPYDLVGVATYSSQLRLVQELTNDHAALLGALGGLAPTDPGRPAPEVVESPEKVEESNEEEEPTEDLYVPDEVQFDTFNTDRRLAALAALARAYRDVPQRKALVYFSGGMRTTGTENQAQIRTTIAAANRSNLTFYAVDSRGLVSLVPGGDATRGAPRGIALFTGGATAQQEAELASSQETLVALAHATGGTAFLDSVDLTPVFDRVLADTRIYYVLGYVPRNKTEDGRFRKIEVKTRRAGVRLEHRPGYLAARRFSQLTAVERERQLEEVLRADRPYSEIPVMVQAGYFRNDPSTCLVTLGVRLSGGDLEFNEREDRREAEFDFMARVTDPEGNISGIARDTVDVRLPAPSAERLQHGQIFYSTAFELRPGTYTLRTVVRDNRSGKLGSFEQTVAVPVFDGKRLQTSSVILASRLAGREDPSRVRHRQSAPEGEPEAPRRDPLDTELGRLIPSLGKVFLNRQTLYVYFQVYGAAEDPATKTPNLETNLVLIRNKASVQESEGTVVRRWAAGSRDQAAVVLVLPLRGLRRGSYILQAHTRDALTDTNVFSRVPLVIN